MTIQERIQKEKDTGRAKYGPFNSAHEGYAVLKEEVDEVWDVVKQHTEKTWGTPYHKSKKLISELIQVAAVAQRMAEELEKMEIKHV